MPRRRAVAHGWWSDLSLTAKFATAVGTIAGAVVMTGTAWAFLDLPIVSTKAWTLAQVERLDRSIRQHGEVLYDIRRGQLERNMIELEQKKTKRTPDEEFRLRTFKDELRKLEVLQGDQLKK